MKRLTIVLCVLSMLPCDISMAGPFGLFGKRKQKSVAYSPQQNSDLCVDGKCPTPGTGLTVNDNGGFDGQLPAAYYDQYDQQITQPFAMTPTMAPPEISVVIETRTDPPPKQSTEARLADAEKKLAKALSTVETLRREVTRKQKIEVIDLKADVEILELEQADELADMKRQLERLKTKIGGDLSTAVK